MLSSTSRPTLIFPVEDPRVDRTLHVKNALIPAQGPQNFLKELLRGGMRCAHGAARTVHRTPARVDRPGSNRQIHRFSGIFLLRSFKIATTACDGMRRLLEWSLGAASDDPPLVIPTFSCRGGGSTIRACMRQMLNIYWSRPGEACSKCWNMLGQSAPAKCWNSMFHILGGPYPRHARGGVAEPRGMEWQGAPGSDAARASVHVINSNLKRYPPRTRVCTHQGARHVQSEQGAAAGQPIRVHTKKRERPRVGTPQRQRRALCAAHSEDSSSMTLPHGTLAQARS